MLGRCLQILFSEHCINIRKRLAAVEFLCDLAGDDLQTHHFLPQIRMMIVQMSQLGQLGIRAKPAAAAVGKLVHRREQPRLFAELLLMVSGAFLIRANMFMIAAASFSGYVPADKDCLNRVSNLSELKDSFLKNIHVLGPMSALCSQKSRKASGASGTSASHALYQAFSESNSPMFQVNWDMLQSATLLASANSIGLETKACISVAVFFSRPYTGPVSR